MSKSERPVIVVAERFSSEAMAKLHAAGEVRELSGRSRGELIAAMADANALLVRSYITVNTELLDAAPGLKVIGRAGVGLETIDVEAAKARGVQVAYTPGAATRSVAEHAVMLMLAVERRLLEADRSVRSEPGAFLEFRSRQRWRELGEMTLGIVGMGRIGSTMGRLCATGFGMRVLYNDIVDVGPFDFPAEFRDKASLYAEADVVTLHVPLTDLTRGLIGEKELNQFKPGSILINTARGKAVDPVALADALRSGRLSGAGIDVFDEEPLPEGHVLRDAPNLVTTPHAASRSASGLARMNDVVEQVAAVLAGGGAGED